MKVFFPGVAKTFDFPLGAVSVFVDTDAHRAGPEYGHFMDFFSDYRFAADRPLAREPDAGVGPLPRGSVRRDRRCAQ